MDPDQDPDQVVIVGPRADLEVQTIAGALAHHHGRRATILDPTAWPGDAPLTLRIPPEPDAPAPRAIWVRSVGPDPREERFEAPLRRRPFATLNQINEYRSLLLAWLRVCEERGSRLLNPTASFGIHRLKLWQLTRFRRAGLTVPATLATNHPPAVRGFAGEQAELIFKPVAGGGHAAALAPAQLEGGALERLANSPVQFQERIRGAPVRAYVLDGEVVGAGRLLSEELDYRAGPHDVQPLAPPHGRLVEAALAAAGAVGLPWAGVDFMERAGGELVVLEANPSPMFTVFDRLAGARVGPALAAALARRAAP